MDGAEGWGVWTGWRRRSQVCGMWRSATRCPQEISWKLFPQTESSLPSTPPPGLKTVDRGDRGVGRGVGGDDSPACRLRSE